VRWDAGPLQLAFEGTAGGENFHIPTKQKRRSTGQGAQNPLTISGLKKNNGPPES
jgi:hypothetical protein